MFYVAVKGRGAPLEDHVSFQDFLPFLGHGGAPADGALAYQAWSPWFHRVHNPSTWDGEAGDYIIKVNLHYTASLRPA